MGIEHEKSFETEICEYLGSHGWIYERESNRKYDRDRALFPEDLFAWLEETQPEQWAKIVRPGDSAEKREKAKQALLDRLVKQLDTPLENGGGTLNVLRGELTKVPAKFKTCQFQPATTLNEEAMERYQQVRLRVVRQVYYSKQKKDSIDLVLFVNGLPVATVELKTDDTQSIDDSVRQYRKDREPKGEPLLEFGKRALVHFAVSTDEVRMTTRLAGKDTVFLPFNLGRDGGAGNPANPSGAATSYLWEQIWQRDSWLNILGKLMQVEFKKETDPISGKEKRSTAIIFPRLHQWQAVTQLLAAAKTEGPGHKYLIQHSAGSGKTKSIAWLAHGLATLHSSENQKLFDTVVVITDRTVLDDQLQKAVQSIEGVKGKVVSINADTMRKEQESSKSGLLAKALNGSSPIVIVTLQTFPFVLEAIQENGGMADKNFAIIADEAHSSQTGKAAQKLRSVLSQEAIADLDDGGEYSTEDLLAAEMAARADAKNLSFFAFTATPKAKTLELFGREGADGKPHAFHVYSMQQAIEEGFILDVLRNYTTYKTAFKIAQNAAKAVEGEHVDKTVAVKRVMRWVSLHPTNISQKVQIIVEHFRENVAHLLDGHAKAMVVTSSRAHAVKYKVAIDKYLAEHHYDDMGTLVAFSGGVTLEQLTKESFENELIPAGVEPPFNEHNLNPGLHRKTIPAAFGSGDYSVLIVANKYQTGFDQPLLCAMYVDKRLDGVTAVQTLSRLNRILPSAGKDTTYVLDFVNKASDILEAFQPYYRTAEITENTDQDQVSDLRVKLAQTGIYNDEEVEEFAEAFLHAEGKHGKHTAPLKAAADRFNDRYTAGVLAKDKEELDRLDLFRKDVGSYIRLYEFLSQIVNYEDTFLEKLAMFLRLLKPRLTGHRDDTTIDLSSIELRQIKQNQKFAGHIELGGEGQKLRPMGPGHGGVHDPQMTLWDEIIEMINKLFEGEDFNEDSTDSWLQGVVTNLMNQEEIQQQVGANTLEQFRESQLLQTAVTDAVLDHQEGQSKILEMFFADERRRKKIIKLISDLVYSELSSITSTGGEHEAQSN
ncbi:MAG: type I restriction endonuclease [Mobiluncus sp.]|uniref:type I restriction endonuclease subunit R n=1 Tax=Mobiluncus sp. TaxID=47293 RepID=UPI002583353F|nr:type I restriction endonuclease [Mobiluncus sp.]MCI6583721.1 type I restriction endonuclease [Mobiluncus sp.]